MNYNTILHDLKQCPNKYGALLSKHGLQRDIKSTVDLINLQNQTIEDSDNVIFNRAKARLNEIYTCTGEYWPKVTKYLDVGCNDGRLTLKLAKELKIKEIYGVDVTEIKTIDFKFVKVSQDEFQLPYPDHTFELVTIFQVLHHSKDPSLVIKEVLRVLKKGGVLVLREHDATEELKQVIDFEHLLYEKLDLETYIGVYRSMKEWDTLIGLKPLGQTQPKGPTKCYTKAYIR